MGMLGASEAPLPFVRSQTSPGRSVFFFLDFSVISFLCEPPRRSQHFVAVFSFEGAPLRGVMTLSHDQFCDFFSDLR